MTTAFVPSIATRRYRHRGRDGCTASAVPFSLRRPLRSNNGPGNDDRVPSSRGTTNDRTIRDNLRNSGTTNVVYVGIDCIDVMGFLNAVWHVLADLSEGDDSANVCLILENPSGGSIPVSTLTTLQREWIVQREHFLAQIPELQRLRISVLMPEDMVHHHHMMGNGNPCLLLQSTARTLTERKERDERIAFQDIFTEDKTTAAVQHFVTRLVQRDSMGATCPYTESSTVAGVGLEARGVRSGPVGYRFHTTSDAVRATAMFWDCVQECLTTSPAQLSTILLSLPAIGPGTDGHDRFASVVELMGRNLCLFRGDTAVGLVHFHPAYDRDTIHPIDQPAYGHLPPTSWIRPMMRHNKKKNEKRNPDGDETIVVLSDDDLRCSNYQRRAPCTVVNILRASQLDAAAGSKSIVDLCIGDGDDERTERASGIVTYARNAVRLARLGRQALQMALEEEMISMI